MLPKNRIKNEEQQLKEDKPEKAEVLNSRSKTAGMLGESAMSEQPLKEQHQGREAFACKSEQVQEEVQTQQQGRAVPQEGSGLHRATRQRSTCYGLLCGNGKNGIAASDEQCYQRRSCKVKRRARPHTENEQRFDGADFAAADKSVRAQGDKRQSGK